MKKLTLSFLALSSLAYAGCNGVGSSSSGPVAVVDLDAVAQKLGKDKQILQLIEQRQVNLNEQLVATQNSLIQQLNQKKSEFGEISDDEAKQLVQLQNEANKIVATTRVQAQSNLTNFQQEVVNRFRAEAKPIAMELAAKKGCRVVLSKNDSVVFAFDKTVDLTDDLVVAIQSKGSSSASSPTASKGNQAPLKQANAEQNANPKK